MSKYEITEYRQGLFHSGGSVRLVPTHNTKADITEKTGGNNRVSLFRWEKHYSINISGDNNQVQIGSNYKVGS